AGGRDYASDLISANTNEREIYIQAKQETDSDPSAPKEYTDDPTVNYGGGFNMRLLGEKDIDKIASIKGVESVLQYYNVTLKYVTAEYANKYMIGAETYNAMINLEYVAGDGDSLKPGEVIIPDSLREVLGFDTAKDAVGKMVQLAINSTDPALST